jgi:hypothetical protein
MANSLVVGRDLLLGRPLTIRSPFTPRLSEVSEPIVPTVKVFTGAADADYQYGMLGNDQYGDCGFAMVFHSVEVICLLLGITLAPYQTAAVVQAYLAYDHGKDVGVNLSDLCHTLYSTGILDVQLAGYAEGTGRVEDEVTGITQHFGVGFLGIRVAQSMEDAFNAGPGEVYEYKGTKADKTLLGGHAVPSVAFNLDENTVDIITWARRMTWTIPTLQHYLDEHYAPIFPQVKAKGIDGFDFPLLDSLLSKIGPSFG